MSRGVCPTLGPEKGSGVQTKPDLYQAILSRRSVRRYEKGPLDDDTLARVRGVLTAVRPLVPANRYDVRLESASVAGDVAAALGAYGIIVNPPHYLVPYLVGEEHLLADLGFRAEQIAVRLAALALGSCFIGCLGREEAVRARFALPPEARLGALLIFGRPTAALGGRAINALIRGGVGATNKLAADRIFFRETFAAPATPPPEVAPLIEAARHSPSAVDAQPWRFLWRGGELHLFVRRNNPRYGITSQRYNLYDGGICMGNIALALEALGMEGHWALYGRGEPSVPEHPDDLIPLARLALARP